MYSTVRETRPSFERRAFAVPMSEIVCGARNSGGSGTRTEFSRQQGQVGPNGSYCYENVLGIQDVSPGAALFSCQSGGVPKTHQVSCERRP